MKNLFTNKSNAKEWCFNKICLLFGYSFINFTFRYLNLRREEISAYNLLTSKNI